MHSFKTAKGTELPMLNLKGKDYLQVAHRLVWMREEHPNWSIHTALIRSTETETVAQATICDENGRILAMAHKHENKSGFQDHIEKAETGAIGRALALCGYGTQFAPDLDEGERIVDTPIEKVRAIPTPHAKAAAVVKSGPVEPIKGASGINPGTVLVPFGRNKDKPIFQVPVHELEADLAYWQVRIAADGKPAGKKVADYLAAVTSYLDSKSAKNPESSLGMIPTVNLPPMPSGPTYPVDEESLDIPF